MVKGETIKELRDRLYALEAKRTTVHPGFLYGNGNKMYWNEASPEVIKLIRLQQVMIDTAREALKRAQSLTCQDFRADSDYIYFNGVIAALDDNHEGWK